VTKTIAIGASAVLALSVVLLPWYSLDAYEPNGWDATWWARAALASALIAIVALQFGRFRAGAAFALLAAAFVLYRTAQPPDFGFAFDGLDVPVKRLTGCWVALGSSLLALLASSRLAWRPPPAPPEPAPAESPPAPSSAPAAP
jgi:hypothetical protein